ARAQESVADWKQQFLEDAPRKWAEYKKFTERLQGAVIYKSFSDGKLRYHERHEFRQGRTSRLQVYQGFVPDLDGVLCAFNPSYFFRLSRKTAGDPWALVGVERYPEGRLPQEAQDNTDATWFRMLIWPETDLIDLVKRPTFRLLQVSPVEIAGERLVKVE